MNDAFKKVIFDIIKYATAALLGFVSSALTGCSIVPVFNF